MTRAFPAIAHRYFVDLFVAFIEARDEVVIAFDEESGGDGSPSWRRGLCQN